MEEHFLPEVNIIFAILLSGILGLIPIYIGSRLIVRCRVLKEELKAVISGGTFGAMIFFLIDVLEGASVLGVDFGGQFFIFQMALLFTFITGFTIPFILDQGGDKSTIQYHRLSYIFALGIGFHSFGEGVVIGYDLLSGYGFTLTQRIMQTLSFILHKVAEGFIISIPLLFTNKSVSKAILYSSIIAGAPLMVGTGLGYIGLSGSVVSYLLAAGSGSAVFIILRMVRFSFKEYAERGLYLGALIGFIYMYFSGLIHSVNF